MNRLTLGQIESAIRASWSAETSHAPSSWTPEVPSAGQCWTSAYVLRELLGGEIVLAEVDGTEPRNRHAWNRLSSGVVIDITFDQFDGRDVHFTECEVPEEILMRVCGGQAELLLQRAREALGLPATTIVEELVPA